MFKKVLFLAIALGITIIATFVQQFASYDRPRKALIMINEEIYTLKLPVVHDANEECVVEINIPDTSVTGKMFYRVHESTEAWHSNNLIRMSDNLISILPITQPNVKLEYYLMLNSRSSQFAVVKDEPVVIRFQKEVPKYLLYPYVLLMFLALIISNFAGMLTVYNIDSYKKYVRITFYLFCACLLFGLIWHIISFRHFFLQVNPNNDLSFFKYLIILGIWWVVYKISQKKDWRYLTLGASVLTLVLYCLPPQIVFSWILSI